MVFLTEQTNQKFQISHEGIIWKDKRSIKTGEQNSFFLSYEWSLLDCRSKDGRKYVWSPSWAGQHIDCFWRWVTNHSTTFLTTAIICWTLKLKIAGLRQSRDMSIVVGGGEAEAPLPRLWTFTLQFFWTVFVKSAYKSVAAKVDKIRRRTMSNIPGNLGNSALK